MGDNRAFAGMLIMGIQVAYNLHASEAMASDLPSI